MLNLDIEFINMLLISALAGGLLGVEREYRIKVIAGTRTFMLFSLLGTFGVYISSKLSLPFINYLLLGAVFLVLLLGVIKNFLTNDIGITTVTAFFLSFLLGVVVGLGLYLEAISASFIITGILISKKYSQMLSAALELEEMRSAIEFGMIAFVLYPVVPYATVDAFGLINPQILLRAIIAITTIGFASFLILRISTSLHPLLIAALGALVHYQKTVSILARSKNPFSAIAVATSAMFFRNLLVVAIISFSLFKMLLIPAGVMIFSGMALALLFRRGTVVKELDLSIPFAITPALIFSIYYIFFTFAAYLLRDYSIIVFTLFSFMAGIPYSVALISSLATLVALDKIALEVALVGSIFSLLGSALKAVFISRKDRKTLYKMAVFFVVAAFAGFAALLVSV